MLFNSMQISMWLCCTLALLAQVARSLEKKVHELLEGSVLLVKDCNTQQGRPARHCKAGIVAADATLGKQAQFT
jgi:hypothetical protein